MVLLAKNNKSVCLTRRSNYYGCKFLARSRMESNDKRSAASHMIAKEEEIKHKKMEIRDKVQAQLGGVVKDATRLATVLKKVESLADPMDREVVTVCKKIGALNRKLKPLSTLLQKKEKEYRDALNAFVGNKNQNEQLLRKLMELVGQSERLRMQKLEELSQGID